MKSSIEKDNEKFDVLNHKQRFTVKTIAESNKDDMSPPNGDIDADDKKMDRLSLIQFLSNVGEDRNLSLEEKYEEEIAIQDFIKRASLSSDKKK